MSVRRGLAAFLALSMGVSAIVLLSSFDRSTFEMIVHAHKVRLVCVLLLVILAWAFDALKLFFVVKAAGEGISCKLAVLLNWLRYFGCAITPMQSGGGPFQVYFLFKSGIPIGKGVAITLTSTLMTLFQLGFIVPVALFFQPELLQGRKLLQGVFSYVLVFVLVSWSIVVISLLRPRIIKKWAGGITLLLKRWGFLKPVKVLRVVRRINREIDTYNRNFRIFFSSGMPLFVLGFLFSCLQMVAMFSILPCLIWSVGLEVRFIEAFLAQALFLFILYFVPTPGASGVAEGGGAAIFSLLVPWNIAGVMAITWRFFTEYLSIAMGAIVAVRMLGWGMAEELLKSGEEGTGENPV
ncbi:MAG: flippase-like domain-containing protein [Thermovirgaceae bacterium]|nr:flippase-like domain-containing protein [Synergistales bacterium]MDI9393506.1 flippase-like domain-containing protein [Synergistota bacterium]MDD3133336.1 flippase-like domain-containing protein [Synergistales bacterium]MDD3830341.1 flippase-like domain-containing protein [Synergistales bacterium]MDD4023992.1 flippase-like domain-containing protein [Synergistales bacterium]